MGRIKFVDAKSPPGKNADAATATSGAAGRVAASYRSDGVDDNDVFLLPIPDYYIMLALTGLAAFVRLFRIWQPSSVVFDEVHFGGFASKYIKGRFFMDVHPPLAKMIIALTGWLAGFNGGFDFKDIGKDYIEPGVPYIAMRMFPALCGIFLAPAIFLTLKAAGCRTATASMGGALVIFENGLLTQARLILLDSPLIAGTALTAFAFTAFTNQHELGPDRAFSLSWWFWLAITGLGLGLTVSVKWVGLFTIGWVGCLTALQLWVLLGDCRNVSVRLWFKHLLARSLCLIALPSLIYLAVFAIHLGCLRNPGDGDGFMSSQFQATLGGKAAMRDVPADVVFGSRVAIRHVNTQGGYLHSHPLMYPTGSQQQQITLYPHKDDNNMWLLENQTQPLDSSGLPINGTAAWDGPLPIQPSSLDEGPDEQSSMMDPLHHTHYIRDGDIIRLYHLHTHRRLHSHDVRPPVTEAEWQNEVSAYGYEGFPGDANDLFRIEIVKNKFEGGMLGQAKPKNRKRLRTIQSQFRLVHIMTGCTLFSHRVKLPDWASEQQEVTCARGGTLPNSLWYIEHNEHPLLSTGDDATVERVNYPNPSFLARFLELQMVMWKTNAGLIESHAWDSRPAAWPMLLRGINFWGRDHRQIYLLGNPVVWWSSTAAVAMYAIFKIVAIMRWQRSFRDYSPRPGPGGAAASRADATFKRLDYEVGTFVLGWAFHYFPFFLMERQLFLHHYFPALYFAILAFCQGFDFVTARIPSISIRRPRLNMGLAAGFVALSAIAFMIFSPLAYGNKWTRAECSRVRLVETWDFDCNAFYESYSQYGLDKSSATPAAAPTPAKPFAAQILPDDPGAGPPRDAAVSGPPHPIVPPPDQRVLAVEEKVEYRDQDGNVLDPDMVRSLEGQIEFRTEYKTRIRVVDSQGQEMPSSHSDVPSPQDVASPHPDVAPPHPDVAPPHPDVEGPDPETTAVKDEAAVPRGEVLSSVTEEKQREEDVYSARPGSDGNEATQSGSDSHEAAQQRIDIDGATE